MHPLRPRSRRTTGSRRRRLWRAGRRASAWRLIGSDRRPGHRQLCARRVKELDRVAGGVLQQDLLAARSADGVVAESQARGAQPLDVGRTRAARPNSPLLGRSGVVTDDDVRTRWRNPWKSCGFGRDIARVRCSQFADIYRRLWEWRVPQAQISTRAVRQNRGPSLSWHGPVRRAHSFSRRGGHELDAGADDCVSS
jgi:hypothetical protein